MISRAVRKLFEPVFLTLVANRRVGLLLAGVGGLQVGLTLAGVPAWPCPIKSVLGVPCPGCGLSTAVSLLLHGQWRAALEMHAFAPIFLLGIISLAVVSLTPETWRGVMLGWIEQTERRTGVMAWLLMGLMVYWGLRLLRFV